MDLIGGPEGIHILNGIWPNADIYESGPVYSAGVNLGKYDHATFVLSEGAGGTGTTTITVQACTDTAGTSPTAIAFRYRLMGTQDTWGASTAATAAAGYPTVAGANKMIAIDVDACDLTADKPYVRVALTELVDAVCIGSMIIICKEARYPQAIPLTAIA
jgi:hypothetical protein